MTPTENRPPRVNIGSAPRAYGLHWCPPTRALPKAAQRLNSLSPVLRPAAREAPGHGLARQPMCSSRSHHARHHALWTIGDGEKDQLARKLPATNGCSWPGLSVGGRTRKLPFVKTADRRLLHEIGAGASRSFSNTRGIGKAHAELNLARRLSGGAWRQSATTGAVRIALGASGPDPLRVDAARDRVVARSNSAHDGQLAPNC